MASPRRPQAPAAPRFVQHAKRPEWGVGHVTDVYAGLVRVRFADGVTREFRADVLEPVAEGTVPPEVLAAAASHQREPAPVAAAPARSRARTRKERVK